MKTIKKTASIMNIHIDFALNIRQVNNYDLASLKAEIEQAGRINTPLVVKAHDSLPGHFIALQGNRRTGAGQLCHEDPECTASLKEALSKVDIIVVSEASAMEELGIILDQGSMKQIASCELLEAVWRMDRQFQSEQSIINQLYNNLASYTGKTKKLNDVPTEKSARAKFLKTWFHGTVGNYFLATAKMGEYVRKQMFLTHKAQDGLLIPEHKNEFGETVAAETVEVKMTRERVTQLSAAKSADEDANGGWTPDNGGVKFNELLAKFKQEDAGTIEVEKKSRPSAKELNDKADVFKSPILRAALKTAAGDADAGKGLFEMDEAIYRLNLVTEVLRNSLAKLAESDVQVYKLVESIIGNGPAADVERALSAFYKS